MSPLSAPLPHAGSDIGQIAITVSEVAQATVFGRGVLGLKFLFPAGPTLAFVAVGAVRLRLSPPQGSGEVGENSLLYFKVKDVVELHAAMVARGAAPSARRS